MNKTGQITVWQWFRLTAKERQRRATEFRAADRALQAYEPPGREETELYRELYGRVNELYGRVNELWPTVPWWCRR